MQNALFLFNTTKILNLNFVNIELLWRPVPFTFSFVPP